jgi:hypothetical protein
MSWRQSRNSCQHERMSFLVFGAKKTFILTKKIFGEKDEEETWNLKWINE